MGFLDALAGLPEDGLEDVARAVRREQQSRLPQKSPGDMGTAEFARWAEEQIRAAELTKLQAERK